MTLLTWVTDVLKMIICVKVVELEVYLGNLDNKFLMAR